MRSVLVVLPSHFQSSSLLRALPLFTLLPPLPHAPYIGMRLTWDGALLSKKSRKAKRARQRQLAHSCERPQAVVQACALQLALLFDRFVLCNPSSLKQQVL